MEDSLSRPVKMISFNWESRDWKYFCQFGASCVAGRTVLFLSHRSLD